MTEEKKRFIVKRLSLEGLAEGLDTECYVLYRPATYEDTVGIDELDAPSMSKREQIDWQQTFVRDHFVAGKMKFYSASGFELGDMQPEDTAASIAICDAIYSAIMGFDLDPKVIRKAVAESALQTTDAKPSETTSSETSQTVSTPTPTDA